MDRKACRLKESPVVFPTRIADGHRRLRQQLFEVVGTHLKRSGTAKGLNCHDPVLCKQGMARPEDHLLHCLVVGGRAFDRLITPGGGLGRSFFFCLLNALK